DRRTARLAPRASDSFGWFRADAPTAENRTSAARAAPGRGHAEQAQPVRSTANETAPYVQLPDARTRSRADWTKSDHDLISCLSMISAQTPRVCHEGKPVSRFSGSRFPRNDLQCSRALAFDLVNPSAKANALSSPLPLPRATTAGRLRDSRPRAALRVDSTLTASILATSSSTVRGRP